MVFRDRQDAGRRLAERLMAQAPAHPVVLGMARGGLPVAALVAARLVAPLDVIIVRKIGLPWQPELGVGAIVEGGGTTFNDALMAEVGVQRGDLRGVIRREQAILIERVARYRGSLAPRPVEGRMAILVDDGLATGFTARAAIGALRARGAGKVILAVPVAPLSTVEDLRLVADDVVALDTPAEFYAIGESYLDFSQTTETRSSRPGRGRAPLSIRRRRSGRRVRPAAGGPPARWRRYATAMDRDPLTRSAPAFDRGAW
jgi:predicted phosphoribosyltransferase